ncbi:MAG: hypothetical protein WCI77_08795 [Candidatus Omnitrophota bacterium]
MKKTIVLVFVTAILLGCCEKSFASDWDVAGKILTGIEGVRIITGGKVDVIGTMTGINRTKDKNQYARSRDNRRDDHYRHDERSDRTWVPDYAWRRIYVPEHKEYHAGYGEVIVEGHYIKYKVEDGGHWETRYFY